MNSQNVRQCVRQWITTNLLTNTHNPQQCCYWFLKNKLIHIKNMQYSFPKHMTASHIQFQAAWLHTNSVNVNFKWSCSKGLHMNLLNCFYSLSKWTIKSCWKSHTCWLRLAFTTNEHSSRHILCISIVMLLFVVLSYVGSVTLHKRQFYWSYSGQSQPRKLNTIVPEALALMV